MDLIVFSHLRWNFVYQRPQHLISRFADDYRVFYIEEPIDGEGPDGYTIQLSKDKVWVVVPHLQNDNDANKTHRLNEILVELFHDENIVDYWFWYYSPMALSWSGKLNPALVIYDCMDELSAFKFAPPELVGMEKELLRKADIVFTGGKSLYDAKKNRHPNIYCFPSSIDKSHFHQAREEQQDPADQESITKPRLGFFGVIDERFDIELVEELASKRPQWQIVLLGPVVKINPEELPKNKNIHYLGMKNYEDLPAYISNWDIAIMPFAINESTRYISPTKTPEYLAAGKPVVSTRITDVVHPYGEMGIVKIAGSADEFINYIENELTHEDKGWLKQADNFLANMSWDNTWKQMNKLVEQALLNKQNKTKKPYNVL